MIKNTGQKGYSNLGYLVTLLVVLAGVFVAYNVLPFYYAYYELLGEMEAKAVNSSELSDKEIIQGIKDVIKKNDIPADIEDLKINRTESGVIISLDYQEVFYVDFGAGYDYDLWVFNFSPRVERN